MKTLPPAPARLALLLGCVLTAVALTGPVGARATEDIKGYKTNGAGAEKRFDRPGVCLRGGQGSSWWRCTLSPQCAPMAALTQEGRAKLIPQYNQALLGVGMGPMSLGPSPQLKPGLVAMMLNYYFAPRSAREVAISIGPTNTSDWAHVWNTRNRDGKYPLVVSDDLFYVTPGMLLQSLGHEMVHLAQYGRTYGVRLQTIDSAVVAFRELEAST